MSKTTAKATVPEVLLSALLWAIHVPVFLASSAMVWAGTFVLPTPTQKLKAMQFGCWMTHVTAGIRFRFQGHEHIPPGACVWIGNHVNNFDPMAVFAASPNYIIALENPKHFKWPIYGAMISRWGNLPVASSLPEVTRQSMETAVERLKQGISVMVFPEGTRSRSGQLGKFKRGGFKLAIEAGVPILPFVLKGAYELYGAGFILRPGVELFKILPPVSTEGLTEDDIETLMERVRELIAAELAA